MENEMDNPVIQHETDDLEWQAWYWENEAREREKPKPTYTPGDRWSDPAVADPDCLLINWI